MSSIFPIMVEDKEISTTYQVGDVFRYTDTNFIRIFETVLKANTIAAKGVINSLSLEIRSKIDEMLGLLTENIGPETIMVLNGRCDMSSCLTADEPKAAEMCLLSQFVYDEWKSGLEKDMNIPTMLGLLCSATPEQILNMDGVPVIEFCEEEIIELLKKQPLALIHFDDIQEPYKSQLEQIVKEFVLDPKNKEIIQNDRWLLTKIVTDIVNSDKVTLEEKVKIIGTFEMGLHGLNYNSELFNALGKDFSPLIMFNSKSFEKLSFEEILDLQKKTPNYSVCRFGGFYTREQMKQLIEASPHNITYLQSPTEEELLDAFTRGAKEEVMQRGPFNDEFLFKLIDISSERAVSDKIYYSKPALMRIVEKDPFAISRWNLKADEFVLRAYELNPEAILQTKYLTPTVLTLREHLLEKQKKENNNG